MRLKEERKRLKLTQAEAGSLAGVTRESWSRYEGGGVSPGMEVLEAFALAGADVQFILTGTSASSRNGPAVKDVQIDVQRLERIAEMLEKAAQVAGKRWPMKKLAAIAAEVYNALSADQELNELQLERVLKLVVNR
ncbi:helix-turn-helix domain-containing protein [Pseudomonas neuropathica]